MTWWRDDRDLMTNENLSDHLTLFRQQGGLFRYQGIFGFDGDDAAGWQQHLSPRNNTICASFSSFIWQRKSMRK